VRDIETNDLLREHGWEVIRVWEHEFPEDAARKVIRVLRDREGTPLMSSLDDGT
jgi:DNA mismatch endonuclease (patch repair protein)